MLRNIKLEEMDIHDPKIYRKKRTFLIVGSVLWYCLEIHKEPYFHLKLLIFSLITYSI